MIAYISVPWKEIQTLTSIVPVCELMKAKARMPSEVARVDSAIACFFPMCFSRPAPTNEPGSL